MAATEKEILQVRELTKSFYGVAANDKVSFSLRNGEVHGLLGENGAGKSTLCSILAGLYRPDSGDVILNSERIRFRSPLDASNMGIGMVHQHFKLISSFTVAENMVLGLNAKSRNISLGTVEDEVRELARQYGLDVEPSAHVWQLSVGEQQRVEILRQLFRGARILILDEPTAVLAPQECDRLFEAVRHMVERDHSVILVSHKMDEILSNTDRVTVLVGGRNAGTLRTNETDAAELAKLMIGSDHLPKLANKSLRRFVESTPVLTIRDLEVIGDRGTEAVSGASLEVLSGQIVGVAGVAGNGQREFQQAIVGRRQISGGSIMLRGRDITQLSSRARSRSGLAYVPEDRLGTGLASGLTLEENLILKSYNEPPYSHRGVLSTAVITAAAEKLVKDFDIRGARSGMPVSLMSGGNLQKAILARELSRPHDLLLAASPTRGLDLAATASVRQHIRADTEKGGAVLLFSEDLGEIVELSDLILVLAGGRIVGSYTPATLDISELGLLMTGAKVHN
ncbi:MAG: ABC transporter ATP-binding protein [Acidimicrobiales bacterium]|nr:heme ABC transporter ATP-binding protein [Chloroflexota bacterium]MDP6076750.1 ABC transporter ATP-binding protein [Acidimicrobiales bacterium]